jgi:hypothetical protein
MSEQTPAADSIDSTSSSRRRFLGVAAAAGAGLTLGGTAVAQQSDGSSASATFDDQTSKGSSVTVQSATLPEGGYVVIHDSSLLDGAVLESVIGVSEYLEAGTHESIQVSLFEGVEGADFERSMLEEDQTLIAMPHRETNGNETYDFVATGGEADGPYTMDGSAVVDEAAISVKSTDSKPSASVTFDDQSTGGKTVTVASVTVSEGGYVVIHDSSLLDGAVLESVIGVSEYLEAGSHEDVTVTLFDVPGGEFETSMLEEDQTLIAMPHRETNDNETYDFLTTEGEVDGPYTEDGEAVVDEAAITVEAQQMPSGEAKTCFPRQESDGESVSLPYAELSEGGFVAIHDERLLDGKVFESVIGVSEYLEPGRTEDVEVRLFEGVPGGDFEGESLSDGAKLFAMPHFDSDGNETYDFLTSEGKADGPYTEDGEPVLNRSTITLTGGEEE